MQYISTKGSNSVKSAPLYFFYFFLLFSCGKEFFLIYLYQIIKTNRNYDSFRSKI